MSRFVPAESLDKPTKYGDEWLKAQQELDESKGGGKSLYDVLQANKGVKAVAWGCL